MASDPPTTLSELLGRMVFLGFNSYVTALDRDTGEILWFWRSPKGTSDYVAILLDGDRLIVSVQGYTYCLNPLDGTQIWANFLQGYGVGIPTLASARGMNTAGGVTEAALASRRKTSD